MYMVQRSRSRRVTETWRSYVADSLQYIPQNKYMAQRFEDMLRPCVNMSVDDIIEGVIAKISEE